ncbi:hypothetical protein GEMRC1_005486 [Eukaryota sp. GEM-RC1]
MNSVWNSLQVKYLGVTTTELRVKEATSLDPWPASTTLLDKIVDATFSSYDLAHTFRVIFDRLGSPAKHFMQIQKSLILLEYLILHGSDSVVEQSRTQIYRIRTLKDFHHINEEGKDIGKAIRNRANHIVKLLTDEELLVAEQADAQRLRSRIQGRDGGTLSGLSSERHARARTSEQRLERSSSITEAPSSVISSSPVEKEHDDVMTKSRDKVEQVEVDLLDLSVDVPQKVASRAQKDDLFGDDFFGGGNNQPKKEVDFLKPLIVVTSHLKIYSMMISSVWLNQLSKDELGRWLRVNRNHQSKMIPWDLAMICLIMSL